MPDLQQLPEAGRPAGATHSASSPEARRPADATTVTRADRLVVAHYGSAAGELAVCVRAVGMVDRADLAVLSLRGSGEHLDGVLTRAVGQRVVPGGCALVGDAWWCRATPGLVFVLARPDVAARQAARLRDEACRSAAFAVCDESKTHAAIGLVGRATPAVLVALGVYGWHGDPRRATPFARGQLGGNDVRWLLESDHAALALVPRASLGAAWDAIALAGRPFGLGKIGHDALDRFALVERRRTRGASAAIHR